jgi:hypothetical protein
LGSSLVLSWTDVTLFLVQNFTLEKVDSFMILNYDKKTASQNRSSGSRKQLDTVAVWDYS